jgi:diacylglycerol kinase
MIRPPRLIDRLRSFKFAFRGIGTMVQSQENAWVHVCATISVVAGGLFFRVTPAEWCWLVLAIMAVWSAEALNTALEFLADVTSPDFNPLVEKAKDVAAGAVLIAAVGAAVIGALIFGTRIIGVINKL